MISLKAVVPRTGILMCLTISLVIPSALGQKVKVEFDPEADFSHIRHYEWRTHPVFEKNPQLQETYAVAIQLVMSAGNAQLMKQGLQPVDSSPDVFVTFFVQAQPGQSVNIVDIGPWWNYGYGWYAPPTWTTTEIDSFLSGMLVMDIVDARTSKLLWRAYCSDKIRDMSKRDKNITAATRKALQKFPPKQK